MKPMGLTSTPFISYHEIKTDNLDLFEDAWGLSSRFGDVIGLLRQVKPEPEEDLIEKLIDKIRKHS